MEKIILMIFLLMLIGCTEEPNIIEEVTFIEDTGDTEVEPYNET